MRTLSIHPTHTSLLSSLQASLKIIVPLLVLVYAFFHLSMQHWIMLGLLIAGVMAVAHRFSHMDSSHQPVSETTTKMTHADGGTFRTAAKKQDREVRPVVHDGGIERSASAVKKQG